MSDNVDLTNPAGLAAADEVLDATLNNATVKFQYTKIADGVVGSTNKLHINASNEAQVNAADGSLATLGAKADAANAATDTTAISGMAVLKQISKSVQALATDVGSLTMSFGQSYKRVVATADTNLNSVKASPGNVTNIDLFNYASYDVFVKFFDKASAPVLGTDTPVWTVPIKAGTGFSKAFPNGRWFTAGVAYAMTKAIADGDTTALAAGDVTGQLEYV